MSRSVESPPQLRRFTFASNGRPLTNPQRVRATERRTEANLARQKRQIHSFAASYCGLANNACGGSGRYYCEGDCAEIRGSTHGNAF